MKHKIIGMLLVLCLIIGPMSFASSPTDTVDVGLMFRVVNQKPVLLNADTGFELVKSTSATNYEFLVNLYNHTAVSIYKIGEYVYNSQDAVLTNGTMASKGTFTLYIGDRMNDIQTINTTYAALKEKDAQYTLDFAQGYQIAYGIYNTKAEAEAAKAQLEVTGQLERVTVVQLSKDYVGVYGGETPLAFIDTTQSYALKADLIRYNNVVYRGQMLFKRYKNSDLTLINRVNMAEYLYGVVPKEVSASWPMASLKAQAIAAKNYLLTNLNSYKHIGFNVTNTTLSQVYGGYSAEHERTNLAVDETIDMALYYGDLLVECFYNAHSGGYTETAANVWSKDLPYIQSFADPYGETAPNANWKVLLGKSEIESRLLNSGYTIGSLKKINIVEKTPAGRVLEMAFVGDKDTATLKRSAIRTVLPSTELKSTLFQLSPYGGEDVNTNAQVTLDSNQGKEAEAFDSESEPTPVLSASGAFMEKQTNGSYTFLNNGSLSYVEFNSDSVLSYDVSALDEIAFYGKGYGHGVGMSQWGARKMADMGMSFEEILYFYYKGTVLRKIQ